jgi:hypothetical protein
MPAAKPLSKSDCDRAMRHTKSNRAAARYLGVSYQHYKRFAKEFFDENGKSYFDIHLNQQGKGIKKFLSHKVKKRSPLVEILNNEDFDPSSFTPEKIKSRLIQEAILPEECSKCGFNEQRILDYRAPMLLVFKDGNKLNYRLNNLELHCYNCYFLHIGNVLTTKEIKNIEDNQESSVKKHDWGLDEDDQSLLNSDYLENMKALGIFKE